MSDEYIRRSEIIETRWKCPSCGTDNRGKDMNCTSCSAPKDESSVYEVDASAAAVDDAEAIADAKAGEHWICAFCEKENRGRRKVCRYCGADQNTRARRQKEAPAAPEAAKRSPLLGCAIVLASLAVVVALVVWALSPREVDAKVVALQWEQAIELHTRTTVNKEAWHDEVPGGAFDQRCEKKHRRDDRVVDHYRSVTKTRQVKYESGSRQECRTVTKDLGNGYAERSEVCRDVPEYDYRSETYTDQEPVYRNVPVYEPYCRFAVYEWPTTKRVARTGAAASGLAWPATDELGAPTCAPCSADGSHPSEKRCCHKVGRYAVTFQDPKKQELRPTYLAKTAEEFAAFAEGQTRRIQIDDDVATLVTAD